MAKSHLSRKLLLFWLLEAVVLVLEKYFILLRFIIAAISCLYIPNLCSYQKYPLLFIPFSQKSQKHIYWWADVFFVSIFRCCFVEFIPFWITKKKKRISWKTSLFQGNERNTRVSQKPTKYEIEFSHIVIFDTNTRTWIGCGEKKEMWFSETNVWKKFWDQKKNMIQKKKNCVITK